MIRSRYVGPDATQLLVGGREVPAVSRQTIVDAAIEGIVALELTGGYLSISLGRRETGFPNEKYTHEAVITLQDRGAAKPQPEEIIAFSGALVLDDGLREEDVDVHSDPDAAHSGGDQPAEHVPVDEAQSQGD